jgi:hypothetical protein
MAAATRSGPNGSPEDHARPDLMLDNPGILA